MGSATVFSTITNKFWFFKVDNPNQTVLIPKYYEESVTRGNTVFSFGNITVIPCRSKVFISSISFVS
jgi:hypothetical protein